MSFCDDLCKSTQCEVPLDDDDDVTYFELTTDAEECTATAAAGYAATVTALCNTKQPSLFQYSTKNVLAGKNIRYHCLQGVQETGLVATNVGSSSMQVV